MISGVGKSANIDCYTYLVNQARGWHSTTVCTLIFDLSQMKANSQLEIFSIVNGPWSSYQG